jgi:hypothetical protein
MRTFKTAAKNKETKQTIIIESAYKTKTDFIKDLRANGYSVNPAKVKQSDVYNFIVENTNCELSDWKAN